MNKKLIVVIIGFLWIAIAAGIILSKEQTLRTGRMVVLETVPVDPRDFLRGDYVVLRYKLSSLDLNQIESKKKWYHYLPGERIYVKLEPKGKFWQAVAIYEKKGTINGLFIKGKAKYYLNKKLEFTYGIELSAEDK